MVKSINEISITNNESAQGTEIIAQKALEALQKNAEVAIVAAETIESLETKKYCN
jgi:hypothetical protein